MRNANPSFFSQLWHLIWGLLIKISLKEEVGEIVLVKSNFWKIPGHPSKINLFFIFAPLCVGIFFYSTHQAVIGSLLLSSIFVGQMYTSYMSACFLATEKIKDLAFYFHMSPVEFARLTKEELTTKAEQILTGLVPNILKYEKAYQEMRQARVTEDLLGKSLIEVWKMCSSATSEYQGRKEYFDSLYNRLVHVFKILPDVGYEKYFDAGKKVAEQ